MTLPILSWSFPPPVRPADCPDAECEPAAAACRVCRAAPVSRPRHVAPPNRLRVLRVAAGLTCLEAGVRAGVSESAWARYERGLLHVSPAAAARVLGVAEAEVVAALGCDNATGRLVARLLGREG